MPTSATATTQPIPIPAPAPAERPFDDEEEDDEGDDDDRVMPVGLERVASLLDAVGVDDALIAVEARLDAEVAKMASLLIDQ